LILIWQKKIINQGKNNGRDIPMAGVRFTSNDWAKKDRMLFVAKLKGREDFGRIHMVNSVCLAPPVRVDILKAVSVCPEASQDSRTRQWLAKAARK
jgi:hypothetical protein